MLRCKAEARIRPFELHHPDKDELESLQPDPATLYPFSPVYPSIPFCRVTNLVLVGTDAFLNAAIGQARKCQLLLILAGLQFFFLASISGIMSKYIA